MMKRLIASVSLAATTLFGASLPATHTQVKGDYIEARTADVFTGPCYANSEVDLVGNLAVFGWKINQGNWQGVKLDGLSVVGVIKASSTLGNVHGNAYPVKAVLIVDENAGPEQRLALKAFAQKMGGDLMQDIVKIESLPISFTFENDNIHSGKGRLSAGTLAEIRTRSINNGDHLCTNEETWYQPLNKTTHAMPAVALAHSFKGTGLNTTWSSPDKRSAFIGEFNFSE